ncbi:MAG: aminoglycoside phosphotransferase family protein [Solirubrobacteraceae bacterium]
MRLGRAACSPAHDDDLVLKLGWRHWEAEQEAAALRLWNGDGAVRCLAQRRFDETDALLLERCVPGGPLVDLLPEPAQDVVVATLLRRLWAHPLPAGHGFSSLALMCGRWAHELERDLEAAGADRDTGVPAAGELDPGLVRAGADLLRELPAGADREVLLCTDLHAGNILASRREPWLAIDPKPFVGDPAYDAVQHLLNCDARLTSDPVGLAERLAGLLDVDARRVRLWLFARCAQESLHDRALRDPARRLAP